VVAILTALGLTETLNALRRLTGDRLRFPFHVSLFTLLAIIALINLFFYFRVYTPRRVYGNPTAEVADVLCDELERRESVPPVYFDGPPVMYWDFGAIAFRLRDVVRAGTSRWRNCRKWTSRAARSSSSWRKKWAIWTPCGPRSPRGKRLPSIRMRTDDFSLFSTKFTTESDAL
jgi:hypothetical protein